MLAEKIDEAPFPLRYAKTSMIALLSKQIDTF